MAEPIIAIPVTVPAQPAAAERRAAARYTLDLPAAFCHPIAGPMDDSAWQAAGGHDISSTGIGLKLTHRLEPGTLLAIDVEGIARPLLAHVVHATPQAEGHFLIGCEFINPLTEEELLAVS